MQIRSQPSFYKEYKYAWNGYLGTLFCYIVLEHKNKNDYIIIKKTFIMKNKIKRYIYDIIKISFLSFIVIFLILVEIIDIVYNSFYNLIKMKKYHR